MLSPDSVRTLHLADVSFPDWHPRAGQTGPVNAFLVGHPDGPILIDTGLGPDHPGIDAIYRPVRRPLPEALATIGVSLAEVSIVINTHLHFDHCGSNSLFPGVPIFVQAAEVDAARAKDYTIPKFVDFPGARYEPLDGQAEIAPGVSIVPTPAILPGTSQ